MEYYSLNAKEVLKKLKTSEAGLTIDEAKKRLSEFGYNEIKKESKLNITNIILSQLKNAFLLLLIFAGALTLILGEEIEAIAIFSIILLNVFLGFLQEYKAEKAMNALAKMATPTAKVIREGALQIIPARELVPGDIIELEAGDIAPADTRLLSVSNLQIDESTLTGESIPSKKVIDIFERQTPVADQENMAFMGTIVTYGKGKSIVTSTGLETEFGKIASSLQTTEEVKTPLQIKFQQLAKQIGIATIALIITVFIIGMINGLMSITKMILFAVVLTVSTVPNSLPIIVTVSLSLGARRLAKKNMLIRKLPAAESLGEITIICTDKTGTLTKNQMTITDIFTQGKLLRVSGAGYDPKGAFYFRDKQINPKKIELLLRIGYLCNNAKLSTKNNSIIGDPTEGALIVLGKKGKIEDELHQHYTFLEELPFDSERKRMTVVYKNNINKTIEAYVKGAPDSILKECDRILIKGKIRKITQKDRIEIQKNNSLFARKALRVLALAYREIKNANASRIESNLIFTGLVGMIDPPREEIYTSIQQCYDAGIKVMMITGDHAETASAIGKKIGLLKANDIILTGEEIQKMNDDELMSKIEKIRIVARALPIQKLRIVEILQKKGHIVAMTGDGVNDAPAIKKADIGISMGITGTDVAKETSKATLVDDNFATIVNAIAEGRNIYDKMIKSARYLLTCNTGEITTVFIAILLNLPLPLLPLQLLLINLLTDDLPALGLGIENAEEETMQRPPRDPRNKPITKIMFLSIVIVGLIIGAGTLFMFLTYLDKGIMKAQTIAFTTLVILQMFAVLSSKTLNKPFCISFSNKWLIGAIAISILIQVIVVYARPMQIVFGTVPLQAIDWLKIVGISILGFFLIELSKFITGRTMANQRII